MIPRYALSAYFRIMFGAKKSSKSYALSVRIGAFDAGVVKAAGRILATVFSAKSAPSLCIGEKVKLRFLGGGGVHGREAEARVASWRDRGAEREIEFQMNPEVIIAACAGMGLRDDFRVAPNPADRLVARMRSRGRTEWRRSLLKDLSLTGIGVLVNSETDQLVVDADLLEVELDLPDGEAPLAFVGRVRFRGIAGCSIKHGIEIEYDLTIDPEVVEERLRAYSMQRQRELLRASKKLEEAPDESDVRRSA